ncbi:MAG: hypothetical protein ACTSWW_04205 [Promethearchaeota archaeon]
MSPPSPSLSQEKLQQALVVIEKISEKLNEIETKQTNFVKKIEALKAQKLRFLEKAREVESREKDFREKLSQIQEAHTDLSQKQNLALKAVTILRNNLKEAPAPQKSVVSSETFFADIESSLQQSALKRETIKQQESIRKIPDQPQGTEEISSISEKEFTLSGPESTATSPPSPSSISSWGFETDLTIDLPMSSAEPSPSAVEVEPTEETVSHLCIICHSPVAVPVSSTSNLTLGLEYVSCPNLHYLHYDCVKKWLERSDKCPVCHEQYDKGVLAEFESYVESQKKEKEEAKRRQNAQQKAQQEAKKREAQEESSEYVEIFQKALTYFEEDKFEATLDTLWALYDAEYYPKSDRRMLKVLFYISLTYYSIGKYAQSVQQLMNIAKIDFEYPLVFYYLGLCYLELEITDKTKWAFVRALNNTKKLAETDPKYLPYVPKIEAALNTIT